MKFIVALTIGAPTQGSAIAILERRPRKGPKRQRRVGYEVLVDQDWIDDHALIHLERIGSTESVPQTAKRVCAMLTGEPLARDAHFVLDVTTFGRALMEMFYDLEPAPPQYRITVAGEAEGTNPVLGGWTVPPRDLLGALSLHVQEGRLKIADGLSLGPALTRALEGPDVSPDADVYRAAAIATWMGRRYQTHGPWPSTKPPAYGSSAWRELEVIRMDEADERRRREEALQWGGGAKDDESEAQFP